MNINKKKQNDLVWRTEKRRVNDLLPYKGNPRFMSDQQTESLKKSLTKFNLAEIPAIDTDNTVLAGNQRLRVLQLLGRGEEIIDIRIPNRKLTSKECNQYLLTSNALHGDWNFDLLREFDTELLLNIDFNDDDLLEIFDNQLETEDDNWDEEAELKKIKEPTVKLGEMYALGQHRLLCADARNLIAVRKLVGDTKINLIDIDPIFNIGLSYDSGIGTKKKYGGITDDRKTDPEYRTFLKSIIQNALAVSADDVHSFIWCDQNYIGMIQSLYEELSVERKRVCSWVKNNQNPTPQVAFNKATESCVYGTRGKPFLSKKVLNLNEIANKEVGSGSRLIDDLMDLFEIWLVKRLPSSEYEHPTQKPPTLHEKALRRCSKPGDAVLDLCAGSGSLMVACEQLKRRAFLVDWDPIFATLILNRYEKLTGTKAKKLN